MHKFLWDPYNADAPEPNFTKCGCEGRLDIAVLPIVLVSPEFFVSVQRLSEEDGVWIFAPKMEVLSSQFFWGDFHGVSPLTNNTVKTSVGEDLVKMLPAVAEQSRQKKKNTELVVKRETPPSLAASGAA